MGYFFLFLALVVYGFLKWTVRSLLPPGMILTGLYVILWVNMFERGVILVALGILAYAIIPGAGAKFNLWNYRTANRDARKGKGGGLS